MSSVGIKVPGLLLLITLCGFARPGLAAPPESEFAAGTAAAPVLPAPFADPQVTAPPWEQPASPQVAPPPDASAAPEHPAQLPPNETPEQPCVWGIAGFDMYPDGRRMAPNGVGFDQLFSFDLNFNIWIWRRPGLYLFVDSQFWGQKPGAGVTSPGQGNFDFSKREFDFTPGFAWNYHGFWEARVFAYSYNNLNRGTSLATPYGFDDGIGIENRYYLSQMYANLGTPSFDQARATFVSVGYYPASARMVGASGVGFHPALFVHSYLTYDLWKPWCYAFADLQFLTQQDGGKLAMKQFILNGGLAVRPCSKVPRLEFRVGTQDYFDLIDTGNTVSGYVSVRYIF